MKITIDQSGKIEVTSQDTVLGVVGETVTSIRITAKTKRRLQEVFRRVGKPKMFVPVTFACLLGIAIGGSGNGYIEVTVDIEYPGKEALTARLIREFLEEKGLSEHVTIHFALLGKSSRAHSVAFRVFKRQLATSRTVTFEEMCEDMFETQNGRPTLKHQV